MKPIRTTCKPRPEVLRGDLEDAIFAADFGHVVECRAPKVYQDPAEFFRNTYPTAGLQKIVQAIFGRLADPKEAGIVLRLSTGFGGGKTHTLIALWHLAQEIGSTLGTDLLAAAGRPKKVAVAGVDGDKLGSEVCGRHDDLVTRSLWGELAFQLGSKQGYDKVQAVDDPEKVPDAGLIRQLLPGKQPVLILMDELVLYMGKLSEQGRRALLAFINALISETRARPQTVLVITDPATQTAYQRETEQLGQALGALEAQTGLDEILGRKMTDFNPIGEQAAEVILRRLFEDIDHQAAQLASREYHHAYQRLREESPDLLPAQAASPSYAQQVVRCYPFHPRLLETAQNRLTAMGDFQKGRGTLRLFARILRDVWDSESDTPLITAGDLDWSSDRIQADLLTRLNRDLFKAAVDADVLGHARQLDEEAGTDVHRRVAAALLLESLPETENAALDRADLTLAVLRPSDAGHEPGEALDRLLSVCWHTYRADESGRRFQFRTQPNANKVIEERAAAIDLEDARQAVLTVAQGYFGGQTFQLIPYPTSPRAVPESARLKLVLCSTEDLAQRVCDFRDDSNPEAKEPRRFRNALFALAPTPTILSEAVQDMRRQMAAEQLARETTQRTALKQQVEELLPALRRRARIRTLRAFNRVFFTGRPPVTLAERYLVPEDSALEKVQGQANLKQFLDDNKLIYQPAEAIDVELLVDRLVPGATPCLDHEGAYTAKSIHERTLESPQLRLMMNEDPVRLALLRANHQGKLVVREPDGSAYDAQGHVTGPAGQRRRLPGRLQTLQLNDDVLVAPPSAPCVAAWLKEDEADDDHLTLEEAARRKQTSPEKVQEAIDTGDLYGETVSGKTLVVVNEQWERWNPAPEPRVTTSDWEQAIEYAAHRPLLELTLTASTPEEANGLLRVAQPFGALSLDLSVSAWGEMQDGGMVNFSATGLKPTHPLKPVDVARRIYQSAGEGAGFTVEAKLEFGDEGKSGTESKFQQALDTTGGGLTLFATFGPEPRE